MKSSGYKDFIEEVKRKTHIVKVVGERAGDRQNLFPKRWISKETGSQKTGTDLGLIREPSPIKNQPTSVPEFDLKLYF